MKKIRTLLVTLLAVIMVIGSTMTAFAEELETLDEKNIPISVKYSRTEAANNGKDESLKDKYCIVLEYDELKFSYVAESITWDAEKNEYVVALTDESDIAKPVKITNKSNLQVEVTPTLVRTTSGSNQEGAKFKIELLRNNTVLQYFDQNNNMGTPSTSALTKLLETGASDELIVRVSNISFKSNATNFDKTYGNLSLTFSPIGSNVPTTGGSSHTGGGAN